MRNMLFRVRQTNKNPPWIAEPVWKELLRIWANTAYKNKRQQDSENRSSNCGGRGFPQCYSGNRTFLTHRKKLKEKIGEDPSIVGTFKKLNTTTKKDGEVVWRNDYYKDVYALIKEVAFWGLRGEAIFLIRDSSSSSKADKENEKDKKIKGLKETVDKMQKMIHPIGPSSQPIQQPSSDHVFNEKSDEEDDVTNDSHEESDTE
ncbi:hypothetical protein ACFE04_014617 [Oxalis oulophora]